LKGIIACQQHFSLGKRSTCQVQSVFARQTGALLVFKRLMENIRMVGDAHPAQSGKTQRLQPSCLKWAEHCFVVMHERPDKIHLAAISQSENAQAGIGFTPDARLAQIVKTALKAIVIEIKEGHWKPASK